MKYLMYYQAVLFFLKNVKMNGPDGKSLLVSISPLKLNKQQLNYHYKIISSGTVR